MRAEIQGYLELHYGEAECQIFLQKSSYLDPRYKSRFSPDIEEVLKLEARALSGESIAGIAFNYVYYIMQESILMFVYSCIRVLYNVGIHTHVPVNYSIAYVYTMLCYVFM